MFHWPTPYKRSISRSRPARQPHLPDLRQLSPASLDLPERLLALRYLPVDLHLLVLQHHLRETWLSYYKPSTRLKGQQHEQIYTEEEFRSIAELVDDTRP